MNEQEAPVKAGEEHIVSIKAVGEKGDGIARVSGFVLFVPNVKKGDYVKIKVTKVLPKVGFAEVVEKLERPKKVSKFAAVTQDEFDALKEVPEEHHDDSDDFGADLDDADL